MCLSTLQEGICPAAIYNLADLPPKRKPSKARSGSDYHPEDEAEDEGDGMEEQAIPGAELEVRTEQDTSFSIGHVRYQDFHI